jgi:lysyl-tRNA synthetase, class II
MTQGLAPTPAPTRDDDPRATKERKLQALIAAGINPYPHVFPRDARPGDLHEKYAGLKDGEETTDRVQVAGRIMAMRNSGMFIDLMDPSGKIQIFCHKDSMTEDALKILDYLDIGDIIGVAGTVRRTPRGELSVRAATVQVLTKSLAVLPEKYHGLADVETRYRQRYVDLIVNEDSRRVLRMRAQVVSKIRTYLTDMGGLEVETPMLHPILGGASAKPFITHYNALDTNFYLRIAPELYLKRLMVGGLTDHVFEINKNFRNEGVSARHSPEFTMLESYHAYCDYADIMDLIEDMTQHIVMSLHGTLKIPFGDKIIDFSGPWPRCGMCDLVQEKTGIDFLKITDVEAARTAVRNAGVHVDKTANWGQCVEAMFEDKVEPDLFQPIHITNFPFEISPLAKNHRDNPRLVERFETYCAHWEIANGFTELNDPKIQYERFMDQVRQRESGDDEAQMLDEDYITALEYGLPPCAGWGLGIDRLGAIIAGAHNIRDVICFPTLKPLK